MKKILNVIKNYLQLRKIKHLFYDLFRKNAFVIQGKANRLICRQSYLKGCAVYAQGDGNTVILEEASRFCNLKIYIYGNNNKVTIGRESLFHNHCLIRIDDNENELALGNRTKILGDVTFILCEKTRLSAGEDCAIASHVTFRTSDSHSIVDRETGKRINPGADITIGDHVWFASDITVLKGAAIPSYSVVGSRTLITRKFDEPHIVLAGSPARVIRKNIDWCMERL